MKRLSRPTALVVTVFVVAAAVGAAVAAARLGDPDPGLSPQQQMNADNAHLILDSADARTFALPTDLPAGLEYLSVTRTTASGFEMSVQHRGVVVVLCDQDSDTDSACAAPTVTLLRDERVDGRRVRVAEVDLVATGDAGKVTPPPSSADAAQAADFWASATLRRGSTPAWVAALARGEGATPG